jgi:hypothetical protein
MHWVVFLRAVNVGKANRCQPALIARQLAKFGVINIGAVGTFVVREDVSEPALRAAIARKLPFKCEIMICPAQVRRVALDPDGQRVAPSDDVTGPFSEMALYVLVRRGGVWWVAAGQNTPIRSAA